MLVGLCLSRWSAEEIVYAQPAGAAKKRIVVVGAGMAGLSAARELKAAGFDVVVIEGRDRIGGRIYTNRSWGTPIDLGASWIHESEGNPLTAIARENAIPTVVDDDSWRYFCAGSTCFDQKYIYSETVKLEKKIWDRSAKISPDISYAEAVEQVVGSDNLSSDQRRFIDFVLSRVEMAFGADADKFSFLYGSNMDSLSGSDLLLPEGYDRIVLALAKGLDIRLNTKALGVDWRKSEPSVETDKGSFQADAVILTLPLGVLKARHLRFKPTLPDSKLNVIERMGFGLLDKVILSFPKVFWPKEVAKFGYLSKQRGEFPELLNWYKFSGQPILVGFTAAAFARSLENLSDKEIVSRQMQVLRGMFGSSVPEPSAFLLSRWARDQFALGSYSHIPVGATDADYYYLGQPVGPLFFAGEATNRRFPGTVHGAFFSGIRVAKEVQVKFSAKRKA